MDCFSSRMRSSPSLREVLPAGVVSKVADHSVVAILKLLFAVAKHLDLLPEKIDVVGVFGAADEVEAGGVVGEDFTVVFVVEGLNFSVEDVEFDGDKYVGGNTDDDEARDDGHEPGDPGWPVDFADARFVIWLD